MQIIADYFNCSFSRVDGHVKTRHKLEICRHSRMRSKLIKLKTVNSYHNYVISGVSSEIMVSAVSEDGNIEAIEHKKFQIFGQMWHTERDIPFQLNQLAIFKHIFTNIRD